MHILIYINHKGSYIWRQNKHCLQEKQTKFKMEKKAAKGTVIWSVWQFTTRYVRLVPYSHVYLSFDGIQGGRRATEAGMRWQVGRAGVSNKWLTSSTVLEPEILSRLYVSSSYYSTQNTHFYAAKPSCMVTLNKCGAKKKINSKLNYNQLKYYTYYEYLWYCQII